MPSNVDSWISRGNAWHGKGEYDKAVEDYNQAILLKPNYALVFSNRGNTRTQKGEYEKAFTDFYEALRLDPNNQHAIRNLALALATQTSEAKHKENTIKQTKRDVSRSYEETTDNMRSSKKSRNVAITILFGFLFLWTCVFVFVFWLDLRDAEINP